jgi:hypothetical protein
MLSKSQSIYNSTISNGVHLPSTARARLSKFYSAKRHVPILGGEDFINWLKEGGFSLSGEHVGYQTGILRPPVSSVIREVAKLYRVSEEGLFRGQRGKRNKARQVAMYLIRDLCDKFLKEIAQSFSPGNYGSGGGACSVIERQIKVDRRLRRRIEQIREIVS